MAASGWLGVKWEGWEGRVTIGISRGHHLIREIQEEHLVKTLGGTFCGCCGLGEETRCEQECDAENCEGARRVRAERGAQKRNWGWGQC